MNSTIFAVIQRVADLLIIIASFGLGYWYYHFDSNRNVPYGLFEFLGLGLIAGVLYLVVFQSVRLYERKVSLLNVVETKRLLVGWALGSAILFSVTFYIRLFDLSRLMMSFAIGVSFLMLLIERSVLYQIQLLSNLKGGGSRTALIFGAGVVGRHLYKRIYHSPALGIKVAGFLDDDTVLWGKEVHIGEMRRRNNNIVLGGLDKVEYLIAEKGVQEVFVALPNASYERNLEIVQACRKLGLSVSVVPPTYGHQMHIIEVEDIGGIPILREKQLKPNFLYSFFKRIFDLMFSFLAITFLSPVFFLVALAIRMDSPGPIFFRQKRIGLNGVEFDFYKFRTMHVTADPYSFTPRSSGDPRITRFGKWLRRTSLDELPQFWNVVRGDMSLVGPRPEMPFIVNTYNDEQRERLKVKPGITGVWQISAVRGEPIHANMEYDLFYIEHRSLLLDAIIMIKTLVTAVRGIGAV